MIQRGDPREHKDPYADYDPTLLARLASLPANDLI